MKWCAVMTLVVALAACGRCDGEAGTPVLPTPTDESGEVAVDVPLPGAVYKQAFERAQAELSADNARDRLDELEHAIDRESKAMR